MGRGANKSAKRASARAHHRGRDQPESLGTTPAATPQTQVLDLQRDAGNQATTALLERGGQPGEAPGPSGKRKRRRRRKGARGQAPTAEKVGAAAPPETDSLGASSEPAEQEDTSWSSWLSGAIGSVFSRVADPTGSDSGDELVAGTKTEEISGEFGEQDDESIDAETLFGVPEISISLFKKDLQGELGDNVTGGVELKELLDGYEGNAKFEVKSGAEISHSLGTVSFLGGVLKAEFTNEQFLGDKLSGNAKGGITSEGASLRGELTAFSGYEEKTTGKVTVNVGDEQIASFEGGAGYTIGHGAEAKGHVTFKDGKLSMGSKGSVSYGYGTTWEYKLEIDSPAIGRGLWAYASSWGSWLSGVASSIDEVMTDDDGELINLGF